MVGIIYNKALRVSIISKEFSVGSIVNNYEIDCEKLHEAMSSVQDIIILPLQIIIGVIIVYFIAGYAVVGGLMMIIFVGVLSYVLETKGAYFQEILMEKKDARMKLLNEVLNGIKYIKMNGWEQKFIEKVSTARKNETKVLRKKACITVSSIVNYLFGAQGILMATIGAYLYLRFEFNAQKMITLCSAFWVITWPLQRISWIVTTLSSSIISIKRIEKFLLSEEIDVSYIKKDNSFEKPISLCVRNGNFSWESSERAQQVEEKPNKKKYVRLDDEASSLTLELAESEDKATRSPMSSESSKEINFIATEEEQQPAPILSAAEKAEVFKLQNINFEVKRGSFVAIIGDVGSGKSSLFYSLAGEMNYDRVCPPAVEINGKVSFLPQQPWIINATLRENILFGLPFDQQLYDDVISFAAMESDIKILNNGDLTEIGEKGINLSGGQKARVSLARALYSQSDIYLLDDVLSAVDIHVGTHIMEQCFKKYLVEKTRVMITHNLDYLKYVDYIYMMEAGKIVLEGTLDSLKSAPQLIELMAKSSRQTHNQTDEEPDSSDMQKKVETRAYEEEKEEKGLITIETRGASATDDVIESLTVDEDREKGSIKFSIFKVFYRLWGGTPFFLQILIIAIIQNISIQGVPAFLGFWDAHPALLTVAGWLIAFYIFNAVAFVMEGWVFGLSFSKTLKCNIAIHDKMIKSVLEAPLNLFFDRVPTGRILNRFSDDIDRLDTGMPWSIPQFLASFIVMAIALLTSIVLSNIIIVIPVALSSRICYTYYKQYTALNREVTRLKSISNSPIVSHLAETIQGLSVIRSFSQEKRLFDAQMQKQDESVKNLLLSCGATQWFGIRSSLSSMLVVLPVSAMVLIWKNEMGISAAFAGVIATSLMNMSSFIVWILEEVALLESRLISFERCHKFTIIEPEKLAPTPTQRAKVASSWPTRGEITFRNYSTKYRPNLPCVLKGLNLTIKPGEKVGLVGRTGSGKSSLMLSLLRIIEAFEGSIAIDGIPIENLELSHLREKITVIPQDPYLFEGTLRENVDILGAYEDDQIKTALESVNLGYLLNYQGGLDMMIKSSGENLSAGEKQMICIARALLKHNKIVLIDEATSSIDLNNEEVFLSTIKKKFQEFTVVTIAHRLNTIIHSDRIIVMDDGTIAESGAPEELLEDENSIFRGMWLEAKKSKQFI